MKGFGDCLCESRKTFASMVWSSSVELRYESQHTASNADLFDNRRRLSETPVHLRNSLGLPDNGRGLTQEYYNVREKLSNDALVDLIVRRRTLKQDVINLDELKAAPRKRTSIKPDLEAKIMKTLAWKEMEDELNKEDVVVQVKKKEQQMRKEARKIAPHGHKRILSSQAEERRAFLRTSLLVTSERKNTSDSIKSAIEDFKTKNKVQLVEVPEAVVEAEEVKVSKEIIDNPRILLERIKATAGKHHFRPQYEISDHDLSSRVTSKTDISKRSKKVLSLKSGKESNISVISAETDYSTASRRQDRSHGSRPSSSKKTSLIMGNLKRKKVILSEYTDSLGDAVSAAFSAKYKPGSASSSNGGPPVSSRPKRPKVRRRSVASGRQVPALSAMARPNSRRSSAQRTPKSINSPAGSKPPSQR